MGEVPPILLGAGGRRGGELIGARGEQLAREGAEIESQRLQSGFEMVEERLVRGGIGGAEIVDRLDQAAAEIVGPEPVGDRPGEVRVVGGGGPLGQEPAAIGRRRAQGSRRRAERCGRHRHAGARMG